MSAGTGGRRRPLVVRWLAELALGARFGIAGGREGWLRAGLTAVGIGLGVAMLLLAASVPTMLAERESREQARGIGSGAVAEPGPDTLLVQQHLLTYREQRISGLLVHPEGPAAPVPPGLAELPGPGELVVSPALAELLAAPEGELLRPRLDHPVAGVVGDEGLRGPGELYFYLGDSTLPDREPISRVDRFAGPVPVSEALVPLLAMLLTVGLVALLLPVVTFVAVAARFGGEQRDRRLAALRLVGADAAATRRIAAGEALLAALPGLAVGGVGFLAGRQLVQRVTVGNLDAFAVDVRPVPALAALILVVVPALAVGVTLLAMRAVVVEPLGVVRRTPAARRRLWWRAALPVAGVALLWPLRDGHIRAELDAYQAAAGAVLVLLGLAALLPWLTDLLVRRLRGAGTVAWQLAVRRLQLSGGSTGRVVNGVAVAVAGAIALQLVFAAAAGASVAAGPGAADPDRAVAHWYAEADRQATADEAAAGFAATPGVRSAAGLQVATGRLAGGPGPAVGVASCATLTALAAVARCRDGDVFAVEQPAPGGAAEPAWPPGQVVEFRDPDRDGLRQWTVPVPAGSVALAHPLGFPPDLLATPAAGVPPGATQQVYLQLEPGDPDAIEHVRNTAAAVNRSAAVDAALVTVVDENFIMLERALLGGVAVTLLLVGLSLLVSTVEQLRERRRQLAVLVAFGTRRRTLAASVLWQTALPMALGLLLAAGTGTGLGALLLALVNAPAVVDGFQALVVVGIAAAVVLLVTLGSLPVLWRLVRPDGLRSE